MSLQRGRGSNWCGRKFHGGTVSQLLHFAASAIALMFFTGIIGCTIVLLITGVEDMMTISGHEERQMRRQESQAPRFNAHEAPTPFAH
jgi:hypothetical protein